MSMSDRYYIADPEPLTTKDEYEIEDAFKDWDRELERKYSKYEPDYRCIKEATDRLIRGDYDKMDLEAYRFYYKVLVYKHQCILDDINNYKLDHTNMCPKAKKVLDDIEHDHLDYYLKYTNKYKLADDLFKHKMIWSKLRTDTIKEEIENYNAQRLSATSDENNLCK